MENLIVFVFALAVIISVIAIVTNSSLLSFYQVAQAEKKLISIFRGDVMTFYRTDGALAPTDRVLYITDVNNGEFNIINAGLSDFYSIRVVCWDRIDPVGTVTVLYGKKGSTTSRSIEVLSSFPSQNVAEYNVVAQGFTNQEVNDGNVACVVAGLRFIRGFVPRG